VYAVLGKRRATILKEGMKENTEIFSIQTLLPVVESFGFPEQLLKQTSGSASAQLVSQPLLPFNYI
jgi:ribosome assembly protein 1